MNVLLLLLLCGILPVPAGQQDAATGIVDGVAADANGGALPGVTVIVRTPQRREFQAVTDAQGRYRLTVPAGSLSLRVVLSGFRAAEKSVTVEPGQSLNVDFTLCVGRMLFIDWIAPPADLAEFVRSAGAVAHVRVVETGASGGECGEANARVTASVLEWLKPAHPAGPSVTFTQERWYSEPTPYPVGTELVVFLDEWKGGFVRSHGPSGVFPIEKGEIAESRFLYYRTYVGMPVARFLADLRAMCER